MKKVNLGCGIDYLQGWINVDIDKSMKADIYADITKRLPFKDNSVDEIYCKNAFEHIPNPLTFLMEIKRILKKDGKATIITSNASYFIYHFPRKKAYHDSYNLNHPPEDQHYFMFQKGHLAAFTRRAGMKFLKCDYHISTKNRDRDYYFQKIVGFIIGKKFGYSDFLWELEK